MIYPKARHILRILLSKLKLVYCWSVYSWHPDWEEYTAEQHTPANICVCICSCMESLQWVYAWL